MPMTTIMAIGSYLAVYLLTRNLLISIAAGALCGFIWFFMGGDD